MFLDSEKKRLYLFSEFFPTSNGKLAEFVAKLNLPEVVAEPDDDSSETKESGSRPLAISVNGKKVITITDFFFEIMSEAAKTHTYAEIEAAVKEILPYEYKALTVKPIDDAATYQKENRWNKNPLTATDGQAFVTTNQWQRDYLPSVKKVAEKFNVQYEDVAE